jgi:hypothetical protein
MPKQITWFKDQTIKDITTVENHGRGFMILVMSAVG